MATYARGYADRTAWMHDIGVEEIKAATIRQSVEDYIDACKIVIAFSSEQEGKNIQKARDRRIKSLTTVYNRQNLQLPYEEYIMRNCFYMAERARTDAQIIQEFLLSQSFLMWSDNVTGQAILDAANELVRQWATDEFQGHRHLSIKPVNNPGYTNALKNTQKKRKRPKRGK